MSIGKTRVLKYSLLPINIFVLKTINNRTINIICRRNYTNKIKLFCPSASLIDDSIKFSEHNILYTNISTYVHLVYRHKVLDYTGHSKTHARKYKMHCRSPWMH